MSTTTLAIACCHGCNAEVEKIDGRGKPRLKRGAKRFGEIAYCEKCKHERYVLRAVTFPVVGPVGADWPTLREALKKAWGQSTSLANWMVSELFAADVRRTAEMQKMPKMKPVDLYGKFKQLFKGNTALIPTIQHSVEAKYRAKRYELIWLGNASLDDFRHPVPYPIRGADWKASFDEGNRPTVTGNIAGTRFTLRLRGGSEFRRQLASFRQIVDGTAEQGEMALYQVSARINDGRNGTNKAGGKMSRLMCKLVAWLPRNEIGNWKPEAPRTLSLRSDKNCFLYGVLQDREQPWILNADLAMKWIADHQRFRQRMSEDNKYEVRQSRRHRAKVQLDSDERCKKQRNRINSFVDEAVASLAKFAVRNKVTDVTFMDVETGHAAQFPWYHLKERLARRLDLEGIAFYAESKENPIGDASGKVKSKKRRTLAKAATQEVET